MDDLSSNVLVLALALLCGGAIYVYLTRSRRSARHRVTEGEARYQPYERRVVIAARANNRRPGCAIGLALALSGVLVIIGVTVGLSWEEFGPGSLFSIAGSVVVGAAVVVLILVNLFKNAGPRVFDGREVQLDDTELIIDRSLIDSRTPGDDMFHPHLQRYLYEKYYYRIPLGDISRVTVSALLHGAAGRTRQFPFVYVAFTTFDAVYMIQTRFMGGPGEMRFLKHLEMMGSVPIRVDERYVEYYSYLNNVEIVSGGDGMR